MEFKDRLRAAREKANLTQAQLAEMAGMTQTTISDLERGKSSGTSFSARIANICGVSALWLESGEGDEDVELARVHDELPTPILEESAAGNG